MELTAGWGRPLLPCRPGLAAELLCRTPTWLLQCGDDSSPGIFIVLEGRLGVYLPDNEQLLHTNTLMPGESIGDLDVLDGEQAARVIATELLWCMQAPLT